MASNEIAIQEKNKQTNKQTNKEANKQIKTKTSKQKNS